jgi:hypothetical protein
MNREERYHRAFRDGGTTMIDEMSIDGSKPLPSTEELAAMERDDLLALGLKADQRHDELRSEASNAVHAFRTNASYMPRIKYDALHRTRDWYKHLSRAIQFALRSKSGKRKDVSKKERGEIDARSFVNAAEKLLTQEEYEAIWDEVRRGKNAV